MPGFDDARYLQQVITDLQKRVKKLEGSTLPLSANAKGPLPNWMMAAQIGPGPLAKSAMHLHLDGNQVGVAPRTTVTDGNGVVRFEFGNLAANGVSQAQFGQRTNAADGSPISDSFGVISNAVMSQITQILGIGTQVITGTSKVTLNDGSGHSATITFSLSRQARVLLLGAVDGVVTSGATVGVVTVVVDGTDQEGVSKVLSLGFNPGGTEYTGPLNWTDSLSSGSHTITMSGFTGDASATHLQINGFDMKVYLLGS